MTEATRMGRRGTVVLPARLRRRFGMEEGELVLMEERPDGVLVRPAKAYPLETYPPLRVAELLLNNATDDQDYARACEEVRKLGLDPNEISHERP